MAYKHFIQITTDHIKNPQGGDKINSLAYKAFKNLLINDKRFEEIILNAQKKRLKSGNTLTDIHAIELAAIHAINYIMIFIKKNKNYIDNLNLTNVQNWEKLYQSIIENFKDEYQLILNTRNIQKTVIERGVGYPFIIKHFLPYKDNIAVLDLGCSANIIWKNLILGYKYDNILDKTHDLKHKSLVVKCLNTKIPVNEVIGIDLENPLSSEDSLNWLLSCRNFSKVSSSKLAKTKKILTDNKHTNVVKFIKGNILNINIKKKFDLITISTVLYQFPQQLRKKLIISLKDYLNVGGILLIQDYCHVSSNHKKIIFDSSKVKYSYRLIINKLDNDEFLEILKFEDSSCRKIVNGKHFKSIK